MGVAPAEFFLHPNQDRISGFYPSVKISSHCDGLNLVFWALIYIILNIADIINHCPEILLTVCIVLEHKYFRKTVDNIQVTLKSDSKDGYFT